MPTPNADQPTTARAQRINAAAVRLRVGFALAALPFTLVSLLVLTGFAWLRGWIELPPGIPVHRIVGSDLLELGASLSLTLGVAATIDARRKARLPALPRAATVAQAALLASAAWLTITYLARVLALPVDPFSAPAPWLVLAASATAGVAALIASAQLIPRSRSIAIPALLASALLLLEVLFAVAAEAHLYFHAEPLAALSFLAIGAILALAAFRARAIATVLTPADHLCPTCGYDRVGLPAGAPCPECGAAPASPPTPA